MLGDPERKIAKAFGVLWPLIRVPRRITFVIDRTGIIRGVLHHELDVSKHVTDALEVLKRLPA